MQKPKTYTWQALAWDGREECHMAHKEGIVLTGTLTGVSEQKPYDVAYELTLTNDWQLTHYRLHSRLDNRRLVIWRKPDLLLQWSGEHETHLPFLDGCKFVDIAQSALTNTLPINHVEFALHDPRHVDVMYVDLLTFRLSRMRQTYTRLDGSHYTFEDEKGFKATLTVDEEGFIVEYPGLFRRLD